MSEPLRIGLVAEGITDKLVIQAAIKSLLGERRFILRLLQPEESLPLGLSAPSVSQGMGLILIHKSIPLRTAHRSGKNFLKINLYMLDAGV